MKRIISTMLLAAATTAMAVVPVRLGPVSTYGKLTAKSIDGKGQLVGSCPTYANTPVQVKGMSLFWSSAEAAATDFYTSSALNLMVNDMGIEVIRFAMGVQEKDGGGTEANNKRFYLREGKDDQKALVKSMVYAAVKYDVYIIIDWHVESAQGYTSDAVEFFSWAAKEFGQTNNVIFEVWNEPVGTDMGTVANHANSVIKAIRDENSHNLILVGSPGWSSQPDACSTSEIKDPDNNFACSLHFYAATHKMGGYDKAAETAMANGIPVFASEWGTVSADGNGSLDFPESRKWVDWMASNKISWTNWSASAKNEMSAAFSTEIMTDGLKFTASGDSVKNYLKGNHNYADCGLENYIGSKTADDSFSEGVANGAKTNFVDDLEDGDRYTYSGGFWSAWSDADESGENGTGKSSISNKKFVNDFNKSVYDVVLKNTDSENTSKYVAGLEKIYIDGGDQYNGGYKWDPYIAMGLNLTKDTTEFKDFANCKSISYKYKGAAHNFRVEIAPITNYNYHYYSAEASDTWVPVELSLDMLKQHSDWQEPQITSLAENLGRTKRLAWEVNGKAGVPAAANQPKYNYLYVDDVRCDGLSITAISGKAPTVDEQPGTDPSLSSGSQNPVNSSTSGDPSVSSSSTGTAESSSAGNTVASSSTPEATIKDILVIDDVEDVDEVLNTTGTWYVYNESEKGGESSVINTYDPDLPGYVVSFPGSEDPTNGTQGFVGMKGIVWKQAAYDQDPFVALGLNMIGDGSEGYDLSKCTGLSYRYKGSSHVFKVQDGQVEDYAYHQKGRPDAAEWTTVVISWDKLDQPSWGKQIDLNTAHITKMSWDVVGYKGLDLQPTTDYLYIDDLKCIDDGSTATIKVAARSASGIKMAVAGKTLNVAVAQAGNVKVQIFDMMGHVVETLSQKMTAGTHSVSLEGLSAGNYVVRVMNNSAVSSARVSIK